jgi:hypothetical protein
MLACELQYALPVMNKAVFLSTLILVATSSYAATIVSSVACEIGYSDSTSGISVDYRMGGRSACAVSDDNRGLSTASIGLTTSLPANPAETFSTVSTSFTEETRSQPPLPFIPLHEVSSFARATGNLQFSTGLTTVGTGGGYLAVTIPTYQLGGDSGNNAFGTFGFNIGDLLSFECGGHGNCSVSPLNESTGRVVYGMQIMIPVTLGQTFTYSVYGTLSNYGTSEFGGGAASGYFTSEFSFYAADGTTPVLMEQVPEPGTWWMLGLGAIAWIIAAKVRAQCHTRISIPSADAALARSSSRVASGIEGFEFNIRPEVVLINPDGQGF